MPFHGFVLHQLDFADKFVDGRVGTPKFRANHVMHVCTSTYEATKQNSNTPEFVSQNKTPENGWHEF